MFFRFCKHTVRFTAAPCYHPVMAESSKYTKPTLRENIKKRIMASSKGGPPGKWSARKSQLLVQRYEKAGGGYRGGKSKKAKKLSTWTKQKGRTASGKRSRDTGEVYAPARTIAKLKSSPKGRKRLAAANRAKAKATRAGKQYAKHGLHKGRKA